MKRFLGFTCAIAIACLAVGCGGGDDKTEKTPVKTGEGTSQTDPTSPNASADSENVPENPPVQNEPNAEERNPFEEAAKDTEEGLKKAGDAIEKGAEKAGEATKEGLKELDKATQPAQDAVKEGADKAEESLKKAGEAIKGAGEKAKEAVNE